MKTFTFTTFFLLLALSVSAQSQRLVLLEYFTQASCGPCATYNPTINAMLAANPNTVIALKYQTDWPGIDPMNAHNPTEVDSRVTYYNVGAVPNGVIDGNYYNGHPNGVTIGSINTRASVASPFEIEMTHMLSPNLDSIHVTATITASQAITQPLTARVAVIEKQISFLSPPGTNGETVFHSVMKKFLPNVNGTTLPSSMNAGDEIVITESWKLANVYDLNQLAVVAFVQNTTTKEVHQSALSAPQPLALDAGVWNIGSLPLVQCSNIINPSVTIKNYGASTLTSLDIEYSVNGGSTSVYTWNGSLATGATTVANLPAITVTGASGNLNTIDVTTLNPNGGTDMQASNNIFSKTFNIISSFANPPITQTFSTTPFPPADWILNNPDAGPTWTRVTNAGGFGASSQSSRMYIYLSPSGQIDELFMKPVDFTSATTPHLYFNVAYAQYTSENDRLQIQASTDCGVTWSTFYDKAGAALKTANPTTSSFVPNATQWRAETVDLTTLAGQSEVIMKFKATSAYGNNMFIDDINLSGVVGIAQELEFATDLSVYPVPVIDNATLSFSLKKAQNIHIKIFNNLGELVIDNTPVMFTAGEHNFNLSSAGLDAGVYFITLTSEEGSMSRKVTIIK